MAIENPHPLLDPAVAAERESCKQLLQTQLVGDDDDERIQGVIDAIESGEQPE